MIGRSAVIRSDLMRVSHSWMPKLNILEILTHFWPASEPCRQATINDMDFIFPVRALPSLTCPPCKYEGMDMHSIHSSLSNLGTISLKSGFTGQNVLFWRGSIKRPDLQTAYRYRPKSFRVDFQYDVQLQGLTLCRSVTAGRQIWIFLKF